MYHTLSSGCITSINLDVFTNYPNTNLYTIDKLPISTNLPKITYITYPIIKN